MARAQAAEGAFWAMSPHSYASLASYGKLVTSTTSILGNLALAITCLGAAFWLTRRPGKETRKNKNAAKACFDDPTLVDKPLFDPRNWSMVRVSESDYAWKFQESYAFESSQRFDRDKNVLTNDVVFRGGLPPFHPSKVPPSASKVQEAAQQGSEYFAHVSQGFGCVPSDYGGPLFLLPGLIIAAYVSGQEAREALFTTENRCAMISYLLNHQQEDGGWGTHISGTSTNFGSVLNYTALRLLGVRATHPRCCKARGFLATREGALGSPLWAKLWLAVLGAYDYRGVSPVPPEMWLLPEWFPFHPGKTWCHARLVALPMSYLYGKRFVYPECETDATVIQLRTELYPQTRAYSDIEWEKYGDHLCGGELYGQKPTALLSFGNKMLRLLLEGTWLGRETSLLRSSALRRAYKHISDEDKTNAYIDIGPVNKALNLVCAFAEGDAKSVQMHVARMHRYLWVAEDGMKMQGYLNSMVWDTSFTLLGVCSTLKGQTQTDDARLQKLRTFAAEMNDFLVRNQVNVDPRETQEFRDPSKGGWGFSTKENTYIVSDCTAEALRAILAYSELTDESPKADVEAAVDVILGMQNEDDGAWASYEKRRGHSWYELLNPAAVFGDIMIDYSYVECSSSCIQALAGFLRCEQRKPGFSVDAKHSSRVAKSRQALKRAVDFLLREQREDGSWFGQWGVCFTYATLFAVEAIAAVHRLGLVDETKARACLSKAAEFLLIKQHIESGGWGESVDSCALKIWVPDPSGPNVVNTSWAVMTLVRVIKSGMCKDEKLVEEAKCAASRGARFLIESQDEHGDWSQQTSISGVFNKTCGITYSTYRNSFPIWALAEYSHLEANV